MKRMPDFLVIGAARAGTTALYSFLRQAPDIFMPRVKEPNFFAYEGQSLACRGPGADFINNSITDLDDYCALFDPAPETAILGEASPLYLFEPRAPERIHHHIPQARLVVILRNPVEQAYSHFLYATRLRIEPLDSFPRALEQENRRLAEGWQPLFGYSSFPRYAEQLERYFALFPREQILIRTYEQWSAKPEKTLSEILAFVGADPGFLPDLTDRHNAGGIPRNRMVQDFLMKPNFVTGAIGHILPKPTRLRIRDWLSGFNTQRDAAMPAEARKILHDRLDGEIARLETLIDCDLGHWRS